MTNEIETVIENIRQIHETIYKTAKIIATNQEIDWKDVFYYSDGEEHNCANIIDNYYDGIMDIRVISGISKSKIPKEKRIEKYVK